MTASIGVPSNITHVAQTPQAPVRLHTGARISLFDADRIHIIGRAQAITVDNFTHPITVDSKTVGWLLLSTLKRISGQRDISFLQAQSRELLIIALLLLLASTLLAVLLAGHVTKPLQAIANGDEVVDTFRQHPTSIVLLDLMLPGKDGMQVCRELRQISDVPIIVITAKVEEIDRLLGLELGADDYICKPFSTREVVARVNTVLRRVEPRDGRESETLSRLTRNKCR